MTRDPPLAYLIATLAGLATYGLLHVFVGVDYPVALFLGFVGAHGGLLLGRHILK